MKYVKHETEMWMFVVVALSVSTLNYYTINENQSDCLNKKSKSSSSVYRIRFLIIVKINENLDRCIRGRNNKYKVF